MSATFEVAGRNAAERCVAKPRLGRVLEAHGGNVTHVAAWLGLSRRRLRTRWAKVRELRPTCGGEAGPPKGPAPPSLSALLERRVGHREIRATVGRWLIESTLAEHGGNTTHAARVLGISRAALRRRRRRGRG